MVYGAADPPALEVVDEENDDLPEGFDMRPELAGVPTLDARIFVSQIDWPAYKRRMERRGAASFEELPEDLGGNYLVPYSPAANAFFIRRLPPDQRGGRIPKKHAGRRVAGWCGARCDKTPNAACGNNGICLRPIVLGVRNGHTGHACPADHDHLEHFAGR